jgi:hypothetical protein
MYLGVGLISFKAVGVVDDAGAGVGGDAVQVDNLGRSALRAALRRFHPSEQARRGPRAFGRAEAPAARLSIGTRERVPLRSRPFRPMAGSDDVQEQEDYHDEEDERDAAAAVMADSRTHAIAAETEDKDEDDEKNKQGHTPLRQVWRSDGSGACWLDADCA